MAKYKNFPIAFIGKSGKVYIRQRRADGTGLHHRCNVWPSVEAFNRRLPGRLEFVDLLIALLDFGFELTICPKTLRAYRPSVNLEFLGSRGIEVSTQNLNYHAA